ncbi:MAG: pentapeptide repeat-containing protein, partial [Bdellovibrionales bacterium]
MKISHITPEELKTILHKHKMFREARVGGQRAILSYHNLSGFNLSGEDLAHPDFTGAILCDVNFLDANLDYATMFSADLRNALMR